MALFFIAIGILMIVVGVKNTQSQFWSAVVNSFVGGSTSFFPLGFAIIVIGAIGYIPRLRPISIGLLVLMMVAILETGGQNFFTNLSAFDKGKS